MNFVRNVSETLLLYTMLKSKRPPWGSDIPEDPEIIFDRFYVQSLVEILACFVLFCVTPVVVTVL